MCVMSEFLESWCCSCLLAIKFVTELTSIMAYELDIMAISKFSKTMTLMTLYEPNMSRPQKRVYDLMPVNSKAARSTMPKLAQNNDCDDSNRLPTKTKQSYFSLTKTFIAVIESLANT